MAIDPNRPDFTVGIVGTGVMGRGIAQVAAEGGMTVLLADARLEAVAEAQKFCGEMIARFYAGRSGMVDKMRILAGKPPVPVGRAATALKERRR